MVKPMNDLEHLDFLALARPDGRGRAAQALVMEYARDLEPEDLRALAQAPAARGFAPTIKELRHGHHLLARLIAEGSSNEEASRVTGYDPARISSMKSAPAFAELITYYSTQESAKDLDVRRRLESFGLSALEELQSRLEDDPDRFTNRELKELTEMGLTASNVGLGPKGLPAVGTAGTAGAPMVLNISFVTPTPTPGADSAKVINGESTTILDAVVEDVG